MCDVRCELCTFVVVDNIWFIMCFLYIYLYVYLYICVIAFLCIYLLAQGQFPNMYMVYDVLSVQ